MADRADELLSRNEIAEAVKAAARAAALNPRDPEIASLYLEAAERSPDPAEQARALAHVTRLVPADPRLCIRIALTHLLAGDTQGAREAARSARALLPRRMKDRKRWLATLEHVEAVCGPPPAGKAADSETLELPLGPGHSHIDDGASRTNETRVGRRVARGVTPRSEAVPAPPSAAAAPRTAARRSETAPDASPPAEAPSFLEISVEIAGAVDGTEVLSRTTFSDPEEIALALLAARIREAEFYQNLFAIDRAQGLLRFSHQEETARKVLSSCLGRALLADEVGLGKTIEAGLVLSEYLLRRRIDSALVLVPPSLVGQWREELSSKFGIVARTTEDALFRNDPDRFWSGSGVIIASLATARSQRQRGRVAARSWDLVIIDEAHVLRNANTESYRLVSRLTSRFLLLLTATPVENRIEELYNLVSLIRPGHLGGRAAFLQRFRDAKLRSSEAARADVRSLLAEVMVRNTRALSGVQLPPRFARTVLVQPDPGEAELYGQLAAALRAAGPSGRTRLLLSTLLQEAGSSPFAARPTLAKIGAGHDLSPRAAAALAAAVRCAQAPIATGKAAALLQVLGAAGDPAVVFTRFRATLDFLAAALGGAAVAHERIDGNIPAPLRHEAISRLRERGGVLLSTDVGAEGLNLQFCRRIVNFDLPWEPTRIEQRIGRVHRIGQDHRVEIVNFCLAGSIEERILSILDERINMFELVVGEIEMILGYVEGERDFPALVLEAFAEPEAERRDAAFVRIADALAAARTRYESVKRFDEEFFRNELGV